MVLAETAGATATARTSGARVVRGFQQLDHRQCSACSAGASQALIKEIDKRRTEPQRTKVYKLVFATAGTSFRPFKTC